MDIDGSLVNHWRRAVPRSGPEIPWSDLELVLAIARGGSLRAGAKALQLSHPTLSRRVAELQERVGVRVFEKQGRRLRLTAAGEDLCQTAERIEAEVDGLGRRIAGRDHRLEGVVRIALSPSMFAALAPALPSFRIQYPGITLEFPTGLAMSNLTRREADVAIRFTDAPQETLVGRKVAVFEQAVFVQRDFRDHMLATLGDDPCSWPWVDWDEAHAHHASAQWVSKTIDAARVQVRCDSSLALYQAVRAGIGVGFSPTMLAGPDPTLVRVEGDPFPVFNRPIWVLTHADLRNVGRVRAVVQWLHGLLHVEGMGAWSGAVPLE